MKTQRRILLLNDDSTLREAMEAVLRQAGHDPVPVATSKEALAILRAQPPDLLVQDIVRPEMNGWELARLVRSDEKLSQMAILVASGFPLESIPANLLVLIDGYLQLPCSLSMLCDAMQQIEEKQSKRLHNKKTSAAQPV